MAWEHMMIYFQRMLMYGVRLKYNVFRVDKGAYLFKGPEVYSHSAPNYPTNGSCAMRIFNLSPQRLEYKTVQTIYLALNYVLK